MSARGRLLPAAFEAASVRYRRYLVIAERFVEGPFTIRFADLRHGVSRTATFALANRLRFREVQWRVVRPFIIGNDFPASGVSAARSVRPEFLAAVQVCTGSL